MPAWREAYNDLLPEVSRFYTELGQNLALFDKYRALKASPEYATLSAEQKDCRNEIRDFRLSGAELPEEQKPRFQAIMEELSQLAAKFSENLLDATNAFAEVVTDETGLLAGLPDYARDAAREAAEKAACRLEIRCTPVLRPGHAVRRQSRVARLPVSRLRHPRRRDR